MGLMRDYATNGWKPRDRDDIAFEDWYGEMPRAEDFMPEFPQGTATHMMMYETTSEGTPISPAFATAEELARWLADNNASAFGGTGATYEQWLSTIHRGFAPSTVLTATGIVSGVEALDKESGT